MLGRKLKKGPDQELLTWFDLRAKSGVRKVRIPSLHMQPDIGKYVVSISLHGYPKIGSSPALSIATRTPHSKARSRRALVGHTVWWSDTRWKCYTSSNIIFRSATPRSCGMLVSDERGGNFFRSHPRKRKALLP